MGEHEQVGRSLLATSVVGADGPAKLANRIAAQQGLHPEKLISEIRKQACLRDADPGQPVVEIGDRCRMLGIPGSIGDPGEEFRAWVT